MIDLLLAATMYMVRPGDTLWAISPDHNWSAVCEDNHLANCNLIYPGEMLNVSAPASTTASVAPSNNSDAVSNSVPSNTASFAGTLDCSGLEQLWIGAGGNPNAAFIAAEIAMAESGGQQYATGPFGEEGYWQINPVNGPLATYNPYGNARAAIILSDDGTNWSAWTTYTQGLYYGRCLGNG